MRVLNNCKFSAKIENIVKKMLKIDNYLIPHLPKKITLKLLLKYNQIQTLAKNPSTNPKTQKIIKGTIEIPVSLSERPCAIFLSFTDF
jgi:hypothetical protein